MKRDMKITKLYRKTKHQQPKRNESLERKVRRLEIDVEGCHRELIQARSDVRAMKQAMRDMRDEIALLTNKAQYEIADLE